MTIRGSCHCGAIAYTAELEPTEAIECNCSHCSRKGYLLAFLTPDKFTLETPRDAIAAYTFNTHSIHHQFCKVCGCAPFAEGSPPGGDRQMVAINLRCVEGLDPATLTIKHVDGASL